MRRLAQYEQTTGHSLLEFDTPGSPLMRPRSVPIGLLQSKHCIIAVNDAAELAAQLRQHAGKVSCVITAFGTCQKLQANQPEYMYLGPNKDKVKCAEYCFFFLFPFACVVRVGVC
jgi:hypothetical protein